MRMNERYWLWQAENTFYWAEGSRDWKWEQYGYFYLFKAYGYDGGV